MSVMSSLATAKAAALPKKPVPMLPPTTATGQGVPGQPIGSMTDAGVHPNVNTAALPKPNVLPPAPGVGPTPIKPPVSGGVTMMPPPPPIPAGNYGSGPTPMPPVNPPGGPTTQGPIPGANLSTFGPGHDLQSTQIAPGAGPDRLQLAKDYFSSLSAADQPGFDADIRKITQHAAAGGSTGSGMYRTDLTDAATNRHNALLQQAAGLAYDAGSATIGDQANNRGELRTERDYQTGQANTAVDQAKEQKLLEDYLLQQGFNRNRATTQDLSQIAFGGG